MTYPSPSYSGQGFLLAICERFANDIGAGFISLNKEILEDLSDHCSSSEGRATSTTAPFQQATPLEVAHSRKRACRQKSTRNQKTPDECSPQTRKPTSEINIIRLVLDSLVEKKDREGHRSGNATLPKTLVVHIADIFDFIQSQNSPYGAPGKVAEDISKDGRRIVILATGSTDLSWRDRLCGSCLMEPVDRFPREIFSERSLGGFLCRSELLCRKIPDIKIIAVVPKSMSAYKSLFARDDMEAIKATNIRKLQKAIHKCAPGIYAPLLRPYATWDFADDDVSSELLNKDVFSAEKLQIIS